MTIEKFDEIWNNIFQRLWKEIDVENITKLKKRAKQRVYRQYQIDREYIHKNCMKNSEGYIDRHKIAACLMCAIEKNQPIKIPLKSKIKLLHARQKLSRKMSYINEYVAFYCAVSVMDEFYEYDRKEDKICPKRKKIELPKCTFSDQHGYAFDVCLDLYFANLKNKLNILTYSNLFFILEYDFCKDLEERTNCVNSYGK